MCGELVYLCEAFRNVVTDNHLILTAVPHHAKYAGNFRNSAVVNNAFVVEYKAKPRHAVRQRRNIFTAARLFV